MKWNKVPKNLSSFELHKILPRDKPFLMLWKGIISICEYDEDLNCFYIGNMPATYLGFWRLENERECKITHWMSLEFPEDYWMDLPEKSLIADNIDMSVKIGPTAIMRRYKEDKNETIAL